MDLSNINCCDETSCSNGSIIAVLNFTGMDCSTRSYYIEYYFLSCSGHPPTIIPGVGNQIGPSKISCSFNDGTSMMIRFTTDEQDIGKVDLISSSISGIFCIISSETYSSFYSVPSCNEKKLPEDLKIK